MRSSLMRFNGVGKSMIKSKFVSKHLFHSLPTNILNSNSSTTILLSRFVSVPGKNMKNLFSFLTFNNHNTNDTYSFDIDLPPMKGPCWDIRGHCLGIVCLFKGGDDIFLRNLITGKVHQLPPSILLTSDHNKLISTTSAVGFGYDSKSKDLKVVRIVNFFHEDRYFYPNRVEVYNLSTNRWREIETPATGNVLWDPSFDMYHKGVYYWWALHKYNQILSFDMSKEIFNRIPVPDSFQAWPVNCRTMGVWNGSIVLFHIHICKVEKSFDIWGMKKDESGGVSWSKIFTIGPLFGIEKQPLLIVNSNVILMETEDGQVSFYNINTKELKNLSLEGSPDDITGFIFAKSFSTIKEEKSMF